MNRKTLKINILVVTHKNYVFPNVSIYTPIYVGAINRTEDKLSNLLCDDTGEHISNKNKNYCELTALYWAWKNNFFSDTFYCGLAHYRRYFSGKEVFMKNKIISESEIIKYMDKFDIILPKKHYLYVKNIETHYGYCHYEKDLHLAKQIILKLFPEYSMALNVLTQQNKMYAFNMFIMKKTSFDRYCEWLFSILFELESKIDISEYSPYQARMFGFLSERLFNVWICHNKLKIKEVEVINVELNNTFIHKIKRLLKHCYRMLKPENKKIKIL